MQFVERKINGFYVPLATNEHVAINAGQIRANAKKAKEEPDAQVAIFDQKAANARSEASAGRDKLSVQLADQDKSIRAWANSKIKIVTQKTAAQFCRVREKMSEDRHNADIALKAASTRMTASMDAFVSLPTLLASPRPTKKLR